MQDFSLADSDQQQVLTPRPGSKVPTATEHYIYLEQEMKTRSAPPS